MTTPSMSLKKDRQGKSSKHISDEYRDHELYQMVQRLERSMPPPLALRVPPPTPHRIVESKESEGGCIFLSLTHTMAHDV